MNPLQALHHFVMRRPGFFLIFFLTFLIFSALGLRKAHLELDIYDVLDKNFPTSLRLADMRETFNDVNTAQFVFSSRTGAIKAEDACKIQDFFRGQSNGDNRIESWLSPWHLRRPQITENKLWYFTLLPDPCGQPASQGIQADLQRLDATPWGPLLTDKSHQDFSVNVNFKDNEDSEGKKHFDSHAITDLKKDLDQFIAEKVPGIHYEMSGQAAYRWYFHKIVAKDAIFNLVILLIFLLFFRVFYGTWKAGFFYTLTLLYTLITLYGLLSWIGFPIDLLTNNLFLMTAIAGVADFLFISAAQEEIGWQESCRNLLVPGFFTTFTTLIGFWSLMISDLSIIQRFGFAAGCGALLEWVAIFLVLPVFLQYFHFKGSWIDRKKSWRPSWLAKIPQRQPPKKMTALLCLLLPLSLWAGLHLNYSDTPTKNFPQSHELRQAFQNLFEKRGWESSLYIIFDRHSSSEDQEKILAQIRSQPQVVWVDSALDLQKFLSQGLDRNQADLVLREARPLPFYQKYWQPDGTSRSLILLRSSSLEDLKVLSEKIHFFCRDLCNPVGQNEVFREYSTNISSTLAESFLLSLFFVLCTIYVLAWHRGCKNYLALTLSVIWGPLIMIIMLWTFNISINLVTSIFLAVIVGMTGDNAIQYIFGGKTLLAGIEKKGLASVLLSLLLCISSLTFLGQTLVPIKILGILFFLGFAATLFGDLWALKGLLTIKDKN